MTWLILFLPLPLKRRLPITGDGSPSRSDVDEFSFSTAVRPVP